MIPPIGDRKVYGNSSTSLAAYSTQHGQRIRVKWGKLFWCPHCGYEANADWNGSVNVHHSFFNEFHWQPRFKRSG